MLKGEHRGDKHVICRFVDNCKRCNFISIPNSQVRTYSAKIEVVFFDDEKSGIVINLDVYDSQWAGG